MLPYLTYGEAFASRMRLAEPPGRTEMGSVIINTILCSYSTIKSLNSKLKMEPLKPLLSLTGTVLVSELVRPSSLLYNSSSSEFRSIIHNPKYSPTLSLVSTCLTAGQPS